MSGEGAPSVRHPQIATSQQTCDACPEQHEGQLADGRWFYFRYRFGRASLAVDDHRTAVMGREDIGMNVGDRLQGLFDTPEQRDQAFAHLLTRLDATQPGGAP